MLSWRAQARRQSPRSRWESGGTTVGGCIGNIYNANKFVNLDLQFIMVQKSSAASSMNRRWNKKFP